MPKILEPSLVRILNQRHAITGAGFLVSDKRVMTCSHVISEALGISDQSLRVIEGKVSLDFPFLNPNKRFTARVILHWSSDAGAVESGFQDIAVLELTEPPPSGAVPVNLRAQGKLWDHEFRAYGFPIPGGIGVWASGIVKDQLVNGWLQIEAKGQTGYFISPGFSGSPVLDGLTQQVIGMIVAVERERSTRAAFIIPSDRLMAALGNTNLVVTQPSNASQVGAFNPFEYGSPVMPERFYGRHEQRMDVKNRIGAISPQSLSIVGMRRSGKSSLLQYIESRPSEFCQPDQRPILIRLDFQSQKYRTPLGILEGLRRGISSALGADPWSNNEETFEVEKSLARIRDDGYRTIVLIDEFESITAHLGHFTDWGDDWRAKMSDRLFVSIICSKRSIDEVYAACGLTSPFGNMFSTTILGPFEEDEFHELLIDGFARGTRRLNEFDLNLIEELSGRLPFYTQMAAALLWQYDDTDKVREKFELQSRHRFIELWEDLTDSEQRQIARLASSSPPHNETLRRTNDLILHGLVRPSGDLFSTAFAEFVREER